VAEQVVQFHADGSTWLPYTAHGKLGPTDQDMLPNSVFAYPVQRELPLTDADHVYAALAQFRRIEGVNEQDRALALTNIRKAAEHYELDMAATDWRELADFSE
jgi:hypothetical protein